MRIVIGNHIDPSIRERGDLRAWTQRMLWFARPGDLVVLCAEPDPAFASYVAGFTGTPVDSLRVLVPDGGCYGGRLLDPESLTSPEFVQRVRGALGADEVDEVFAAWPSAAVARFADALGIADRFPGAAFFAQGGGESSNNKAMFRALAAGAQVPIPDGATARSPAEAIAAMSRLLEHSGSVVVKQAHNGAGVGNQLVATDDTEDFCGHVGARHHHRLVDTSAVSIAAYWRDQWDWASALGCHPVVIEEFTEHVASVYSEYYVSDDGVASTEKGTLHYVGRRLSHQTVPLRDDEVRLQLDQGGTRLAEVWRSLGFRGHLSTDAVLTPNDRVVFTEVNAQVSGSLHIYDVIAHRIVDTTALPQRSVVEYHVPPTWTVPDFETFLAALDELGCAYDAASRTGVIVSMPAIPLEPGRAQFVFCLAYSTDDDRQAVIDALDARFATAPAPADASEHVGIASV